MQQSKNDLRQVSYGGLLGMLLKRKCLTAVTMQSRSGVSRNYIEDLISGAENQVPSRDVHEKILNFLEADASEHIWMDTAYQEGHVSIPESMFLGKCNNEESKMADNNGSDNETMRKKLGVFFSGILLGSDSVIRENIDQERLKYFCDGILIPTRKELELIGSLLKNTDTIDIMNFLVPEALKECKSLFRSLLIKYRESALLSQVHLGQLANLTQTTISILERKDNARLGAIIEDARNLADALNLSGEKKEEFLFAASVRLRLRDENEQAKVILQPFANHLMSEDDVKKDEMKPTQEIFAVAEENIPDANSREEFLKKEILENEASLQNRSEQQLSTDSINAPDLSSESILAATARGKFLEKVRLSKCWTVETIAERSGLTPQEIEEIEGGCAANLLNVAKIVSALELSEREIHVLCGIMSLSNEPVMIEFSGGSADRLLEAICFLLTSKEFIR